MRELEEFEMESVCGAGFGDDFSKVIDSLKSLTSTEVGDFGKAMYEGSIDTVSYMIGRVAGDLHPSYYQ